VGIDVMTERWFPEQTLGDLVDRAAERFGDRTALTFGDRTWTFAELKREVDDVARALLARGIKPGDVVGVWMLNRPEWIFLAFAVYKTGAVLLPVNTALREDDCSFILSHSGCRLLFFAERSGPVSYLDLLKRIVPGLGGDATAGADATLDVGRHPLPKLEGLIILDPGDPAGGCTPWEDFVAAGRSVSQVDVSDRAAAVSPAAISTVMYTSGTTGNPKGVLHSHHAIRNVVDQANRLSVRVTDVILMYLPLFHAYGFYEGPLLSLLSGARCVLMTRFDPGEALALLERERATMCFGFSAHFQDLLDHPAFGSTARSSLRVSVLAVGPASMEDLARRACREFGGRIVSAYGMTEIGVGATLGLLDEDEDHSAATSGYPLPGYEFLIADRQTGAEVPVGAPGEVLTRSYQVMEGYLNEPELTKAAIDADGWLHSGDMGTMSPDGYLRIVGRYKDMLRVGAENVDPAEVEALYLAHPAVRAAIVVGIPDRRLDEVGCLCVVPGANAGDRDELSAELLHYADGKLASHKRPRKVVFVDSLPMTPSGKVQRHLLRDSVLSVLPSESVSS
jgi:fatty-acyl-CoA synthase